MINCVWEHNGDDTLLYAVDLPGAYSRGSSLVDAMAKMPAEVRAYLMWAEKNLPDKTEILIVQDASCDLAVHDADSDVLFDTERSTLCLEEYIELKALALRSARCFQEMYDSIPDKDSSIAPVRQTFYGQVPRTAEEMYRHTRNVNAYYFGEIGVDADNDGTILECRIRGFDALEHIPNFLELAPEEGSYGEWWSLRKLFRRFLWHDRIHAKAMYRMAKKHGMTNDIADPFCFSTQEVYLTKGGYRP